MVNVYSYVCWHSLNQVALSNGSFREIRLSDLTLSHETPFLGTVVAQQVKIVSLNGLAEWSLSAWVRSLAVSVK